MHSGLFTISYFIFANAKDTSLFLYHMIWGDESGFDRALTMHAISVPLDIVALLGLSIWGSNCLSQESSLNCRRDAACAGYMATMQLIILLGYCYVCVNLFFKPILLCCYFQCFDRSN